MHKTFGDRARPGPARGAGRVRYWSLTSLNITQMISDKHAELTAFPNISWVELLPGFAAWKDVERKRQTGREERYEGSSPLPTIPGSASHRYVSTAWLARPLSGLRLRRSRYPAAWTRSRIWSDEHCARVDTLVPD